MSLSNRLTLFFIPTVVSSVISFAILPLTTAKLDPDDFGLFALLQSFGALISSFSVIGSGYLWAAYFPRLDKSERPYFVTTMLFTGLIFILSWAFLFWLLWPFQEYIGLGLSQDDRLLYGMAIVSSILAYPWIHAIDYLTLEAKAKHYAVIVITSVLISATITLFCLYYLNLHIKSLFIANISSSLVFGIGSFYVLKTYLRPFNYSKRWVKTIFFKGVPTAPGNMFESGAVVLERNILSASLSLNSLGLYTHSQSYRSLVYVGIKALARTIWPVSLKEAHEKSLHFPLTRAAWEPLFFLLTVGGLLSGAVAKEAITILTHGKFTAVAGYVTCWFIYIAIQSAGKEHMAVLYAANQGVFITYLTVMCQLLFIGCLFVFIPLFGIWGAIVAAISQQLTYRIFIQIKAAKIQTVPFNDGIVLNCIGFVLVSLIVQMLFWDHFEYRITCFSLLIAFHIYLSRNVIKELFSVFRRKWNDFLALSKTTSIKN